MLTLESWCIPEVVVGFIHSNLKHGYFYVDYSIEYYDFKKNVGCSVKRSITIILLCGFYAHIFNLVINNFAKILQKSPKTRCCAFRCLLVQSICVWFRVLSWPWISLAWNIHFMSPLLLVLNLEMVPNSLIFKLGALDLVIGLGSILFIFPLLFKFISSKYGINTAGKNAIIFFDYIFS